MARVEAEAMQPALERWQRVGAHSHIKGLGLKDGKALPSAAGLVGQCEAREAAGIVVDLVKQGKFGGRAILFAGPIGTGKTALALALAKELGPDVPFVQIFGSEIYSSELKKTEFLMRALRRAIGVRIHQIRTIYEGEVTALNFEMVPHPYNPYQKIPKSATIRLRTRQQEKQFKVDSAFAQSLIQNEVEIHDIIQIDAETARIVKLGKSEEARPPKEEAELTAQRYLPIPGGSVQKEKEFIYPVTLQDLDMARARRGGFFSLFFGAREEELTEEDRAATDEEVKAMVEERRAETIPGVLFIDECHMLDVEAFSFLNRAIESEMAPILILATNRGITKIRGTDLQSPHGIPRDMLDRMLIINTKPYNEQESREIIRIRAEEEGIALEKEALEYLTQVAVAHSLRYATQLLAPAADIMARKGSKKLTKRDVEEVEKLFVDISKSVEHVKKFEETYLA